MAPPKVFISYCWSSPNHEQRVIDIATELRESGVDVIFDKWDLKPGQDAVAFMEKMVTDSEIKKVLILSDKTYAKKADKRDGGVGTETQLISKKVYEKQDQEKFVVAVLENDENGIPYVPTYYQSRIHINLSSIDRYDENYEKLLRWIHDKPLHKKPEIGKKPSFLEDDASISLGTSSLFRRAVDAIKNDRASASGAIEEYFETFSTNLEKFRITEFENNNDDPVIESIEELLPFRNEAIKLFKTICQYAPSDENILLIHQFFEKNIKYLYQDSNSKQNHKWSCDNFIFIIHELFLYAIAVLIKHNRFKEVDYLLKQNYYIPGHFVNGEDFITNFRTLHKHMDSLDRRNKRLELNQLSIRYNMLYERCNNQYVQFQHLMQTDLVLYLRHEITTNSFISWRPETLMLAWRQDNPFEIFTRSISKKFFDNAKLILAIESKDQIIALIDEFRVGERKTPYWNLETFDIATLVGIDKLATKP